jgi:alginate O-acetyltransferase complex protein AlgJ
MGLTRALRETNLTLVPKRARRARVLEPAGGGPTDEVGFLVTEIDEPSLPRAVIFRDSFTSALVPFLSEHFSRAVYLWQNDFDADVVTKEHPDVVIQQIVGRHLYNFIPSPELVPQP